MAEWSNAAVSKTVVRLPANRGFESPSLRKQLNEPLKRGSFIFTLRHVETCQLLIQLSNP